MFFLLVPMLGKTPIRRQITVDAGLSNTLSQNRTFPPRLTRPRTLFLDLGLNKTQLESIDGAKYPLRASAFIPSPHCTAIFLKVPSNLLFVGVYVATYCVRSSS